jgi:hypothetical protein
MELIPLSAPKRFCRDRCRCDRVSLVYGCVEVCASRLGLLVVAALEILSKCEGLHDLELLAQSHHTVLTELLGSEYHC